MKKAMVVGLVVVVMIVATTVRAQVTSLGVYTTNWDKSSPRTVVEVVCVDGYKFVVVLNPSGNGIAVTQIWDAGTFTVSKPVTCTMKQRRIGNE